MLYKTLALKPNIGLIHFGSYPVYQTLKSLKENKVEVIWNLAAELKNIFETEIKLFPFSIHTPIEDFGIPDSPEQFLSDLDKICNYLIDAKNIYVHCYGGHGRTGIALATLAMRILKIRAEEGLSLAQANCDGPEVDTQKEFVKTLQYFQPL